MTAYYNILETIKNQLQVDEFVNTVTQGDIFDVDLNKQTIFPLSHIMVNNVTRESNVLRFNVTVMCMDIVDKSKTETTDIFIGNDNEQDVLNTQLAVVSRMLEIFDRGGNVNTFRMDGDPNIEPFTERFENYLAGWSCTFDILVANDMTVCGPLITPAGCDPATYIVQYVDGTPIESGTIPSGGSVTVNVPNAVICQDANYTLTDSDGNVLESGTIASGGSATIVAPDGTSNINKSNGALIQSASVASGGVTNTNIADSVITLENSVGTTLSTTNVLATDSAIIVAPNATVNNSDSTYTASVASGGVLALPDSQLNVNSVDVGDVVSVKTIDVNVTDGVDPVTPDAVSLVGNTLTIEVPSGGGGVTRSTATLMKTGQKASYRTGDDGDLEAGRATDFFTLAENNPFGHTQRFTGITGGYYDQTLAGYYDVNGVATTEALAIPDNIVIDWSTYNGTNVLGHSLHVSASTVTWNAAVDNALAYSVGSYVSGWRLPNINEAFSICDFDRVRFVLGTIFNSLNVYNLWTSTTRPSTLNNAYLLALPSTAPFLDRAKTLTFYHNQVRTFTVTGTTLT